MGFTGDEWFPSRLPFGRFKGRLYQEALDEVRASADYEVFQAAEENEPVIEKIVAAQREEVKREIGGLKAEAERIATEIEELAGGVVF